MLNENGQTMSVCEAQLLKPFGGFAALAANLLKIRCLTALFKLRLIGCGNAKSLTTDRLPVWGCLVLVFIPMPRRLGKSNPTNIEAIFVGYFVGHPGQYIKPMILFPEG